MLNVYLNIETSSMSNPMVIMLVIIMFILLLAIALLANVVMGTASWYREREKEKEAVEKSSSTVTVTSVICTGLLLLGGSVFAQAVKTPAAAGTGGFGLPGLSSTAFYLVTGVIVIELLVLLALLYQLRVFLTKEKLAKAEGAKTAPAMKRWLRLWARLNHFRPVTKEVEADLDLGHDYDGIRELDNRLPPWWLYGFYLTIFISIIYLWRFHVSHTAPLSGEEFTIAMREADLQKAEYLKKAANKIDENTVGLLTDGLAIEVGKAVFEQNCSACHGKAGEGVVGPNLTDDYWLHGGGVKDIFKTIKYGWPEKGMKSWKDDLSPSQIAQVASFVKSLHGTHPVNAKEKQGDLYQDTGGPAHNEDSSSLHTAGKIAAADENK